MHAVVTGIDHTLVGVRDLEAARLAWTRLGFTLTPRGRHIGWGTGNYCIMFPGDYVELLGVVDPARELHGLDRFLSDREGLMGMALGAPDEAGAQAALERAGIGGGEPRDLSRLLEAPDGTVTPQFRLVHPASPDALGVHVFLIRHLTPDLLRRPDWLAHANGARRIRGVTAAVDDPVALAAIYRRLAGSTSVFVGDRGLTVRLGTSVCHFGPAEEGIRGLLGMAIEVADLAATAAVLRHAGIRITPSDEGLDVAPSDATGVALSFVAA
ncbi:MAG: VOC family protein [Rhodospirillaceae bacterium]|nr:VOC family protein [Rhodospirillaceae bacterium]